MQHISFSEDEDSTENPYGFVGFSENTDLRMNQVVGEKRSVEDAGLDLDKSESDGDSSSETSFKKIPPQNGKKTKGRVKIKMEFIDNKLRRYTTFSKRKTGIMKKAYELSTLTGTQVMLLVASETGHVYTFATRKLQPMITSEAGKALIQTCLNSPDPPNGAMVLDQRMSATGFEETDLTYTVGEDGDFKEIKDYSEYGLTNGSNQETCSTPSMSSSGTPISSPVSTVPLLLPATSTSTTSSSGKEKSTCPISVHLPQGFATILAQGSSMQVGAFQPESPSQCSPGQQNSSQNHHQALYRLSPASILSLSNQSSSGNSSSNLPSSPMTVVPTSQPNLSVVSGNMLIPSSAVVSTTSPSTRGTIMYQTPQGLVYSAPNTGTLPEGVILNLGPTQDYNNGSHQFITIPVPVSLSTQQLLSGQTSNLPQEVPVHTIKKEKHKK